MPHFNSLSSLGEAVRLCEISLGVSSYVGSMLDHPLFGEAIRFEFQDFFKEHRSLAQLFENLGFALELG